MAFDNKKVLEAVLRACEADEDSREASYGLGGFPMDYILHINPHLDYLSWMLGHLRARHNILQNSFTKVDFNNLNIPYDIKWFVEFSLGMAKVFDEYDCLNEYASNERLSVSYFSESYTQRDQNLFVDFLAYGREFLSSEDKQNTLIEIDDALFFYQQYFIGALKFLAHGVTLKDDSSGGEVNAWLSLFHLFSTVDPWDSVYKIADSEYPHSTAGFMKHML